MNKMSCFLLLAVLAAGCVSKDGTSVYCHPVFYRDDFGDEKYGQLSYLLPQPSKLYAIIVWYFFPFAVK